MSHRRIRRKVSAYVDAEVGAAEAAEISRHFGECADCRGTAQLVCLMKESLRRLRSRRSAEDGSAHTARPKAR
ncbi:MAG: zf-HC2 domain-containing protein [Euzebyaceae bacterium]|jgi:predicted anti-sigma-YlaC factor YlaD|nr:zf-HC2 domain-containing protein [Euzebyaceae bacterium]